MDRDSLALLLAQGLSVERIAKRYGRDPSTISYWMAKHGLESPFREKHLAKGGIERERLEEPVLRGMSIAEIAAEVGLSKGTVRHWLGKHGLSTSGGQRVTALRTARDAGLLIVTFRCQQHGETEFVLEGRSYYRCKRCRAEGVTRRRRRLKAILVREAGGRCCLCGCDKTIQALEFHHLVPAEKRLGLSGQGVTYSLETLRAEARKCVLLCANCHVEVEYGVAALPLELWPKGAPSADEARSTQKR